MEWRRVDDRFGIRQLEMAMSRVRCQPYPVEHGSDHVAISTMFALEMDASISFSPRRVLNNATWKRARIAVAQQLGLVPQTIAGKEVASKEIE